jgi:hypothetical protein
MIVSSDTIMATGTPPFQLTSTVLRLASEIERLIGRPSRVAVAGDVRRVAAGEVRERAVATRTERIRFLERRDIDSRTSSRFGDTCPPTS